MLYSFFKKAILQAILLQKFIAVYHPKDTSGADTIDQPNLDV
jgi:hypothetical protein